MPLTFLGLGGNVGDVAATFKAAICKLADDKASLRFIRTSSLYRTTAIGENAGDDFLNAVAEFETDLSPQELLKLTQSVEASLGRTHDVRWGPRPLDIDILLYGQEIVDEPDLTIPHPALWYRRFVLDPLAETAPDVSHPTCTLTGSPNVTLDQLRRQLLHRPFQVSLGDQDISRRNQLIAELQIRFPEMEINGIESGRPIPLCEEGMSRLVFILNARNVTLVGGAVFQAGLSSGRVAVPDDDRLAYLTAVVNAATDRPEIVDGPIHL